MRLVVSTHMVPHLWANRNQEHARNSKRTLYFDGDTIYSYGPHFAIARFVLNEKGEQAVLFNPGTYSITTSAHQHMVRNAAHHMRVKLTVPSFKNLNHTDNAKFYHDAIQNAAIAAKRARQGFNASWKTEQITRLVEEANLYAHFFGLRTRFKVPQDKEVVALIDRARKEAQQRREEEKRREQDRLKEMLEVIALWQKGEDCRIPWDCPAVYLRVKGETLQTSRGAEVPLNHATRLLPIIRSGTPYQHNGHTLHVGQFRVDRIDALGNLTAGCHRIAREEVERIAAQLAL